VAGVLGKGPDHRRLAGGSYLHPRVSLTARARNFDDYDSSIELTSTYIAEAESTCWYGHYVLRSYDTARAARTRWTTVFSGTCRSLANTAVLTWKTRNQSQEHLAGIRLHWASCSVFAPAVRRHRGFVLVAESSVHRGRPGAVGSGGDELAANPTDRTSPSPTDVVRSETAILQSDEICRDVIQQLHLDTLPDSIASPVSRDARLGAASGPNRS